MRIYVLALSVWLSLASHARAQTLSPTLTTIYNFTGTNACLGAAHCDGTGPEGLAIGSSGVLYGTTAGGGTYGAGTAFSLTPPTDPGGAWTETVLYSFAGGENGGHDGIEPGGVVIGGGGVLYGTTFYGGDDSACFRGYGGPPGCGTLFSVTPPTTPGGAWAEAVLFSFYGVTPDPSLVTSGAGVLYGETVAGPCFPLFGSTCATYAGSAYVYSLAPPAAPGGGWIQTSLYTFYGGPRILQRSDWQRRVTLLGYVLDDQPANWPSAVPVTPGRRRQPAVDGSRTLHVYGCRALLARSGQGRSGVWG
jgi:hypothetical protein